MVVGIYSLPDTVSPKRRCSEGSASLLPCGRPTKRCKSANADETAVALEAVEAQEPSSSVVLLEENGGIWHVDGLLELLAGALCATFGADPASLDMTCTSECASSAPRSSTPNANSVGDDNKRSTSQSLPDRIDGCSNQQPQLSQLPQLPQRPSPTALTEFNLRVHTAASQPAAAAAAAASTPHSPNPDEDDRSSVASLSAWVVGTQSPRRRGSDGGTAHQGLSNGVSQLAIGVPSGFSFPRRCSGGGGGGNAGFCDAADGGAAAADCPELRWLRRRLPVAARG